jgi:hypothetical protein
MYPGRSLLCALATLSALSLLARPAQAEMRLGPVLDLNVASVSIDSDELAGLETSSLTRYGAGVRFSIDLASGLSLDLSPMYLGKGVEIDVPAGVEDVSRITARYGYVELPVELRYAFLSGSVKPYLLAGPRLSILASGEGKAEFVGGSEQTEDLKETTKGVDFGVAFGGGVDLAVGQKAHAFVEGLYALGLTNFNDDPADAGASWKHRGFEIRAGVTFGLGK